MFSNSTYFLYNNKSSQNFNFNRDVSLILVQTEDNESVENMGGNYSPMEQSSAFNGRLYSMGVKESPTDFKLKMVAVKEYFTDDGICYHREPLPLTNELRREISEFLFLKKYAPLCLDDAEDEIKIAMFTGQSERENFGNNQGWITVNCHLSSQVSYSRELVNNYTNYSPKKVVSIDNLSNAKGYTYPNLWISTLEDEDSITITNLNTGDVISFNNIPPDTIINIDNETREITVNNGYEYGRQGNFSRTWLKTINGGLNQIEIQGKCRTSFKNIYTILS